MPIKLRMVAERAYGYTPGGIKSDTMLALMMQMEDGSSALATSSFGLG